MKYLDNEIEIIEFLEKWDNREILADWLRNEASLDEIFDLRELINQSIFYRKQKEK